VTVPGAARCREFTRSSYRQDAGTAVNRTAGGTSKRLYNGDSTQDLPRGVLRRGSSAPALEELWAPVEPPAPGGGVECGSHVGAGGWRAGLRRGCIPGGLLLCRCLRGERGEGRAHLVVSRVAQLRLQMGLSAPSGEGKLLARRRWWVIPGTQHGRLVAILVMAQPAVHRPPRSAAGCPPTALSAPDVVHPALRSRNPTCRFRTIRQSRRDRRYSPQ
jgi:hypothetical protein